MHRRLSKYLGISLFFLVLSSTGPIDASSPGYLEGVLAIYSPNEVKSAEEEVSKPFSKAYSECPLVVLTPDRAKEIAKITVDSEGKYRVELPPGDYILDVQDRTQKHLRAKPQSFKIESSQTTRVNMIVDTGIR